jgi:hypothetical protein
MNALEKQDLIARLHREWAETHGTDPEDNPAFFAHVLETIRREEEAE